MKKSLLLSAAFCGVVAMSAMEPLTPEQLAKLTVQFNNYNDGTFELSAEVGAEYADESNPTVININNFNGTGNKLVVVADWENGTVEVAPQNLDSEFDEDTYETYYLMIANEEAVALGSPMAAGFSDTRVKGTITENSLIINDWYVIRVPMYFNSLTVVSPNAIKTEVHAANAKMTVQLREVNWDIEDPETWASPVEDTEILEYGVYVNATSEKLTVYNWDDLASCCEFSIKNADGVFTCENNVEDIIYTDGKRSYGLYSFKANDTDEMFEVVKSPLVSEPITDPKEVDFGYWTVYSEVRDRIRTMGAWAKLELDEALPIGTTGIDDIEAAPVEAVYYNLQGIRVAEPQNGVFVKVTTATDGSSKAVKVRK